MGTDPERESSRCSRVVVDSKDLRIRMAAEAGAAARKADEAADWDASMSESRPRNGDLARLGALPALSEALLAAAWMEAGGVHPTGIPYVEKAWVKVQRRLSATSVPSSDPARIIK